MVNKVRQNNGQQKETSNKPAGGNISRSSSSSGSTKSTSKPTLSNRMCAQCQNHGLKIPVRGHKRFCKFRLCNCQNCLLVKERQRIVALHLYVRRAQQQEEDAAEAAKLALSRASSLTPHQAVETYGPGIPPFLVPNFHQRAHHSSNAAAAAAAVDSAYLKADAEEQKNILLYSSLVELRRRHPVPDAALPLLLCILNISNSVMEASEKIEKSLQELAAIPPSSEELTGAFKLHQPYYL